MRPDVPEPAPDHDQRLKVLLKEFFALFLQCFFPLWAERFEFSTLQWLDKEVFLDPPRGEKRQLDLVAKMHLRPGAPPPCEGLTELLTLVHIRVNWLPWYYFDSLYPAQFLVVGIALSSLADRARWPLVTID